MVHVGNEKIHVQVYHGKIFVVRFACVCVCVFSFLIFFPVSLKLFLFRGFVVALIWAYGSPCGVCVCVRVCVICLMLGLPEATRGLRPLALTRPRTLRVFDDVSLMNSQRLFIGSASCNLISLLVTSLKYLELLYDCM